MTTESERRARAAQNELVFRAVNEQILKMTDRFREQLSNIDVVCECSDATCVGTIRVRAEEFTKFERQEAIFVVLPDHEDTSVEAVVERKKDYVVVRKFSLDTDGHKPSTG
jgi:hypothetical protein